MNTTAARTGGAMGVAVSATLFTYGSDGGGPVVAADRIATELGRGA